MTSFGLRFDFRNPPFARTSMAERYRAALEMAEWADRLGFVTLLLLEHHGSADGYLPSPLTMASATAARTERIRIQIAALIAPFYNPLRLAEDIAVIDNISGGRVDILIGSGYVAGEFAMFDKLRTDRVRDLVEEVRTLRSAWTGEPFEFRGRTVVITPTPMQSGGPPILLGGTSEAAARRAARVADGFVPTSPEVWDAYRDEVSKLGKPDPGSHSRGGPSFVYLSEDPERAWDLIVPHALHDLNGYGQWLADAGIGAAGGYTLNSNPAALRDAGQYRVLTPQEYLEQLRAEPNGFVVLHPLMGGVPPNLAWDSLRLLETDVLPHLSNSALSPTEPLSR